jgi:hypothetical protein
MPESQYRWAFQTDQPTHYPHDFRIAGFIMRYRTSIRLTPPLSTSGEGDKSALELLK